ncbi:MAG: acyl carrier protein [Frankiaceae bacterium]
MAADQMTPWLRGLAVTPLSERTKLLEELVVGEFRSALLLTDGEELAWDENYFDRGLTSLGEVQIQQTLETELGRAIDITILMSNPTIGHLLAHLRAEVLGDLFAQPTGQPAGETAEAHPAAVPKRLVDDVLKDLYAS